jgi:hypothetical protein
LIAVVMTMMMLLLIIGGMIGMMLQTLHDPLRSFTTVVKVPESGM